MEQTVKPKARKSIHTTILKWFSDQQRGTLLDAPAGYGHLSMKLKEMGYAVTAGEIDPKIFAVKDMECIYTDLNRRIDADDNTYDYACCVDGLEHMTDPYQAVHEFARVLKPGGYAVFSIPNYSNIERRLKFLFFGYFTKPLSLAQYHQSGSNLFNFHNSILTITILEFMFKINGLEICEIKENQPKRKQYFWCGLVFLIWLMSLLTGKQKREKSRTDLTMKKQVILGGNNLIFILRKTGGNKQS